MKKIIDRKTYDTTTATRVGWWCNDLAQTDFNYVEETLYRKRTGEYFLFGLGGGMTEYAEFYNGASTKGTKIVPLMFEEAREWAEEKLDGDEYIDEFGNPEADDDGDMVAMTITLPKAKAAALRKAAQKARVSESVFIATNLPLVDLSPSGLL